jgi:serine/threonine protein kinase
MEKNVINIKDELLEKGNDIELSLAKEEDKNILSTIFFKKYKPIEQISKGNYSLIYSGINIETNESVAIKLESRNIKEENQLLPNEIFYLYKLRHSPGIVRIITTGRTKKYNILIEPLLGSTLYSLYLDHNKNFTLKDICLISIQCITRLESVHNKGIIHCDIKPENFSIGLKDKRIIYLIDFGLSKKYRSDRTKRHIQFNITKTMCGTARYASMNALSGLQLSRRDDLESLSYMILYFLLKKLPWQGITAKNLEKRYKKIYDKKAELEKWDKFKELPTQIQNFVKYCRSLGFSQDPDYKLMKSYFYDLMNINNFYDDKNFSWILDKSIIGSKMPEFFPRKKYFSLYKFYDKIEKKKLSLSVGNHIKYDFNQDKIINENKKRNNSPIILLFK